MENSISQLIETLRHIARDIFIYLLGGTVVIVNLIFIDFDCNDGELTSWTSSLPYLSLLLILLSYLLGQVIMAAMFIVFDILIQPILFKRSSIKDISPDDIRKELAVFLKNRAAYDYFIERQNQLYLTCFTKRINEL